MRIWDFHVCRVILLAISASGSRLNHWKSMEKHWEWMRTLPGRRKKVIKKSSKWDFGRLGAPKAVRFWIFIHCFVVSKMVRSTLLDCCHVDFRLMREKCIWIPPAEIHVAIVRLVTSENVLVINPGSGSMANFHKLVLAFEFAPVAWDVHFIAKFSRTSWPLEPRCRSDVGFLVNFRFFYFLYRILKIFNFDVFRVILLAISASGCCPDHWKSLEKHWERMRPLPGRSKKVIKK